MPTEDELRVAVDVYRSHYNIHQSSSAFVFPYRGLKVICTSQPASIEGKIDSGAVKCRNRLNRMFQAANGQVLNKGDETTIYWQVVDEIYAKIFRALRVDYKISSVERLTSPSSLSYYQLLSKRIRESKAVQEEIERIRAKRMEKVNRVVSKMPKGFVRRFYATE